MAERGVELVVESIGRFADRVDDIGDEQWNDPTPCSDWDVRALVNHVCNGQLWAPHLLAGETIEQIGDRYDGDVLGNDPKATFRRAMEGAAAAFAAAASTPSCTCRSATCRATSTSSRCSPPPMSTAGPRQGPGRARRARARDGVVPAAQHGGPGGPDPLVRRVR